MRTENVNDYLFQVTNCKSNIILCHFDCIGSLGLGRFSISQCLLNFLRFLQNIFRTRPIQAVYICKDKS